MCDVATIAGIALTAASTAANAIGANMVRKAQDEANAAERIRQRQLDQQAAALNTTSQDRYGDFQGQQDQKASELGDYFKAQKIEQAQGNAEAAAAGMLPASSSNITVRNEAAKRGDATNFAEGQAAALGQLRSFGDLMGDIGRSQAQDASLIGQIGGFKRGSAGVLPLELDQASHAGDGMKLFGDLLNLGGGLALNKGLSGSFTTAAPATSTAVSVFDPWTGLRGATSSANNSASKLFKLYG